MVKHQTRVMVAIFVLVDVIATNLAWVLAYYLRFYSAAVTEFLTSDSPNWFPCRVNPYAGLLAQRLGERGEQVVAQAVASQQTRDSTQGFDVGAGCAFRTDQEEKKVNWLAIERVEVDGGGRNAGGEHELLDVRRLPVGYRHASTDARAQHLLPLAHCSEHRFYRARVPACRRELDQLAQHVTLRSAAERDPDPVHGEQLSQQHGRSTNPGLKEGNLHRAPLTRKRFLDGDTAARYCRSACAT